VQSSYNIEDYSAEQRLLPLARERAIATLINRPNQRGSLFRQVKGKPLPAWAVGLPKIFPICRGHTSCHER